MTEALPNEIEGKIEALGLAELVALQRLVDGLVEQRKTEILAQLESRLRSSTRR